MSRILLLVLTLLSVVTSCRGQVDATRTAGTSGSDVVNAVVDVIKANCILSNDRQFLRRLAYVESLDGRRRDTYREGYDGGIWKVSQQMLAATTTCAPILRHSCDIIQQEFNIDWTKVTWSDLRKPLYSGLAAALYLIQRNITFSASIEGQASLWSHYYHFGNPPITNFTSLVSGATQYECENDMDLAFILDSSGSIADPDFTLSLDFVAKVVEAMNIPFVVRVSALTFEDAPHKQFYFNSHTTKSEVLQAIRGITRTSGGTATGQALDAARNILFTTQHGARPSGTTKRVAVLVTDGQSNSMLETSLAAQRLRDAGVTVFSIGVGGFDLAELQAVASEPKCSHVFTLADFSSINSILREIQQSTCKAHVSLTKTQGFTYNGTRNSTGEVGITTSGGNTTVVNVTCGIAHVYVSYTNPNPNPALYSEVYTATDGHPAYLTTSSSYNGRPVYMTVIGSRLPETSEGLGRCEDFNYHVYTLDRHYEVKCCINNECRPCTDVELRQDNHIREVVCTGNQVEFPNPCTPEAMGAGHVIFPYPYDLTKFIRCDYRGNAYVTLCPNKQTFNPATMACGYETPGDIVRTPLPSNYANPCTPAHLQAQYFYFEYNPDKRYFIHCDLWGDAFLERCPELEIWSQEKLTCVADRPINTATTRTPHTLANPCTGVALAAGHYFFPYPCDHTRYIHCDISGNYWVQFCPGGMFYNPDSFICVVDDPQHGQHGCD